jgi:hypothetical protein
MVRGFSTGALLGVGAGGAALGMQIHRSREQMQESIPMFAQAGLMSTMYRDANYLQIERQRLAAAGRFAGTRPEAAAAQAIGLGYGQTIQQSMRYMQGLGRQVQASGGTMNLAQAAQTSASFLDPMVMRRQQAMGMQLSRVGGQVRDTNEIAMDYIRQYERTINRGRKLNEFDFINLGTPGTNLRMQFQRLYGLDDSAIDSIVRAGMQNAKAGGNLNFGSSAALSAAGMNNQQMLGLQAIATQTSYSQRGAQYGARQQDNWIGAMNVEQQIQRTMGAFEDSISGVTGALIQFERVVGIATAGLGAIGMLGGGMMLGGLRGGGGLGGMARGLARGGGGAGGAIGAGVAAEVGATTAAGGLRSAGRNVLGRISGMGGVVGLTAAGLGIQQAVNANDWGDVFGAAVGGGVAGAAFGGGPLGAVAGAALFGGAAALRNVLGNAAAGEASARDDSLNASFYMTDVELINALASEGIVGTSGRDHHTSGRNRGLYDAWQIRRGSLIGQYLNTFSDAEIAKISKWITSDRNHSIRTEAEGRTAFNNMRAYFNDPNRLYKDSEWQKWTQPGGGRTFTFRDFLNTLGSRSSELPGAQTRYREFFGDTTDPFAFTPIRTQPYNDLLNQLETTASPPTSTEDSTGDGAFAATGGSPYGFQLGDGISDSQSDSSWAGLDPRMKSRLLALFQASGGTVYLGGGGGTRSTAAQRAMFLDRYRPDPNGEVEWNGQRWHRVKGAAAAPPGRSMHEIGLAADLDGPGVGTWLQQNAGRFGLKTFANVNDEPWHVQLTELPNSRAEFEKSGGGAAPAVDMGAGGTGGSWGGQRGAGASSGWGFSIAEALKQLPAVAGGLTWSGAGMGAMSIDPSLTGGTGGAGQLTAEQVAQMAYAVGFRGQGLINVVAIAGRESHYNPGAHNPNRSTGDDSYGLMQINMLGNLGPARREQFGITSNEQLFDPMINLRAAYMMSGQGTDFDPWGGYKGMSDTYNTNMTAARQVVQALGLGDGEFDSGLRPSSGGINMHFQITVNSHGDVAYDVDQMTKEIRPAFSRVAAEMFEKRSS